MRGKYNFFGRRFSQIGARMRTCAQLRGNIALDHLNYCPNFQADESRIENRVLLEKLHKHMELFVNNICLNGPLLGKKIIKNNLFQFLLVEK